MKNRIEGIEKREKSTVYKYMYVYLWHTLCVGKHWFLHHISQALQLNSYHEPCSFMVALDLIGHDKNTCCQCTAVTQNKAYLI